MLKQNRVRNLLQRIERFEAWNVTLKVRYLALENDLASFFKHETRLRTLYNQQAPITDI